MAHAPALIPASASIVSRALTDSPQLNAILCRVQGEFWEMPGMRLTDAQARRLWGLDAATCSTVLDILIAARFLVRTRDGAVTRPQREDTGCHR